MFAYVKLILRILDLLWGPYTLGCLANFYNKKVAKYFSSFWNPGTSRGGRISPRLNQGQLLGSSSIYLIPGHQGLTCDSNVEVGSFLGHR